jgi:hypothetical protein
MFHFRLAALVAAIGGSLIPCSTSAQQERSAREVTIDDGIRVQVAPIWRSRQLPSSGTTKLELTAADGPLLRMAVYFTVEKRRSPADVLQRVAEISGPPAREDRRFLVNGWPAVEATRMLDVPQTSQEKEKPEPEPRKEPHDIAVAKFERTMTAIAAADRAVIIEQRLYDTADSRLREAGRAVVDGVTFTRGGDEAVGRRALDDIDFVRKNLYEQRGALVSSISDRYSFLTEVRRTPPVLVQTGQGEIAMAASYNGVKVAIVTNSGWGRSLDSGVTFIGGNNFPASIPNQGDPALAYGGKTDNFYLGYLGRPNGSTATGGNAVNGCTVSVDKSKDGQTYAWAGHARFCAATAAANQLLCSPDQEQMAADSIRARYRGITPGRAPKDQVYAAWRQFTATAGTTAASQSCAQITGGNPVVELSCSQDSGLTWSGPTQLGAGSDFARVAVGPDGFVYVVYSVQQADSSGGTWDQIFLDKYSSCKTGFVHQWGYPRTIAANARPANCGASIPGLDRCTGEAMNSHTVTVSNFDPKGMVFVVYADGTFNGTDRVIAAIAPNGGFNVTSTHLLSDGSAGRKFLPWACAEGKNLYATWYDRRAATTAAPDLTDFYAGWLRLDQFGPTIHSNINLTGNADPQCNSGWPAGTQNQGMATSCPTPRQPGICQNNTGGFTGLCDFSGTPACPAGSTCQPGRGAPKYGDYNASACAAGRLYAAWTSATTPAGSATPAAGLTTFTRTVQPRVP